MKRLMFVIAIVAAACGGKKDDPAATSGSAPAATMAGSGSGSGSAAVAAGSGSDAGSAAAPVAEVDVPTEVDFEEDASAKITEKTLDTELKALEAELE